MAKVKVKKQSTFIDMTAMSDVTVLLLTFFMLTSTFISKEPIQVTTPSSVSEIKIPESNLITILADKQGKVFLSLDYQQEQVVETLRKMGEHYGYTFTPKQEESFKKLTSFGVPISSMAAFLDLPTDQQDAYLAAVDNPRVGIPSDSLGMKDAGGKVIAIDNEFKWWIRYASDIRNDKRATNPDMPELQLAIKADKETNYPVVKKIMDDLRSPELRKNRYLLITNLKTASSD